MALSLQLAVAEVVGRGVSGSGVSVAVVGVSVGKVKPCLVGGRVEVTKRGGAFVASDSCEMVRHAVRSRTGIRIKIIFLFIGIKV